MQWLGILLVIGLVAFLSSLLTTSIDIAQEKKDEKSVSSRVKFLFQEFYDSRKMNLPYEKTLAMVIAKYITKFQEPVNLGHDILNYMSMEDEQSFQTGESTKQLVDALLIGECIIKSSGFGGAKRFAGDKLHKQYDEIHAAVEKVYRDSFKLTYSWDNF